MLVPLLLGLPWATLVLFVALRVRLPPELPWSAPPEPPPRVSIVVPARDEEHNIETVLRSLARSRYPTFEIIVVDDRSRDGTAELARRVERGNAERILVVAGEPLPEGWLGKPWACWQGAERARGELLLFTDADTVHEPELLARSVRELTDRRADALTVLGRQLMETFWERLVQPQIFLAMVLRFADLRRPLPPGRWRSAIANGQYILLRREAYEVLGGHRSVRSEVVEDQRLAQELVRAGFQLRVARAEDQLGTRMYRSLAELVAGWSKNLILGGLQSLPPIIRPVTPPTMLVSGVVLWLVPPALLFAALAGVAGAGALLWSAVVVATSALFWMGVSLRLGAPWWYGLLYPLGAAVGARILLKSWIRMEQVVWKGREYRVGLAGDPPP